MKFKPALAQTVEAALPPTLKLSGPGQHVRPDFFTKFPPQSLRPLYAERLREKKQRQTTDAQLADAAKRKFPARSPRATGPLVVRDLSCIYVLEFPNLTDEAIEATVRELSAHGEVEFAEREQIYRTQYTPNDTYFSTSQAERYRVVTRASPGCHT